MPGRKCYCFTLNNYTEEEYNNLQNVNYTYLIMGREVGKSGNPHIQGYIEFRNGKRLSTLKKLNNRIHWEPRRGSANEAIIYCQKENNFMQWGVPSHQGQRTDLQLIKNQINKTGKLSTVAELCTSYQQIKFAEIYLKYKEPKRNFKPFVMWFHGRTGTGKSRVASIIGEYVGDVYHSNRDLKWWEGYDANDLCILDEFRGSYCTYHELLRILDRYPYRIEIKGSSRQLLSKIMIITSAYPPELIYRTIERIDQLLRRIDLIIDFDT